MQSGLANINMDIDEEQPSQSSRYFFLDNEEGEPVTGERSKPSSRKSKANKDKTKEQSSKFDSPLQPKHIMAESDLKLIEDNFDDIQQSNFGFDVGYDFQAANNVRNKCCPVFFAALKSCDLLRTSYYRMICLTMCLEAKVWASQMATMSITLSIRAS